MSCAFDTPGETKKKEVLTPYRPMRYRQADRAPGVDRDKDR